MTARTLMAVHAHPDDEVISTGGVLAKYAAQGVRTVVVTCTDGSQGFGPGGVLPGEPGHDLDAVAAVRRRELTQSCSLLGVSHLELLGYRDSGMAGWVGNESPDAFCNAPLDEAAAALVSLIERYEPQVVVTYDADSGGYGHPDHVQAHRVTMAALDRTDVPSKLYFTARSRASADRMAELREKLQLPARRRPAGTSPRQAPAGISDVSITTVIDTGAAVEQKRAALEAHASQLLDTVWVRASKEDFAELFGEESFVRTRDRSGAPIPESDLFAGL
ncbi:MAG: PIG-L family deacetylase [Acidimicrobiaceae bacterium]|nr:PIG-L family deacetylase [Acidimicrobiaceae bacterium]